MKMGRALTIGLCGTPLFCRPRFGLAAEYEVTAGRLASGVHEVL